jgi:hypothetical protein
MSSQLDAHIRAPTNATQPDPMVRKCDICGVPSRYNGPCSPLQRPLCCPPIVVCNKHNTIEVREHFRERCTDCPIHRTSRHAEVVYMSPVKRLSTFSILKFKLLSA